MYWLEVPGLAAMAPAKLRLAVFRGDAQIEIFSSRLSYYKFRMLANINDLSNQRQ